MVSAISTIQTPLQENSGPSNWILDSINSIQGRRSNYAGDNIQVACNMEREPIYNISPLVEDFGSLTHMLADFYAHTNWVGIPPFLTGLKK